MAMGSLMTSPNRCHDKDIRQFYCQALDPIPVPLDQIPNQKVQLGLGLTLTFRSVSRHCTSTALGDLDSGGSIELTLQFNNYSGEMATVQRILSRSERSIHALRQR